MFSARNAVWIASGIAASLAGCATNGSSLENSSERLERSALELQDEARDQSVGSDYRHDAQELANEARDFRRMLSDRDADRDDLRDAFQDLSKQYHALRDETERSREPALEDEFKDVTEAYLDIEREMGKGRDRVASDD
jgi:predicted  nucleic acid-binding Zn-ribbon protein